MLGLYTSMLAMMPNSAIWEALKPEVKWREQAILNLTAIRNGHLQLLRPSLNVQVLHAKDIKINTDGKLLAVY
ncbi:hypothetical protein, partial [Klebsiella pneumoniae]|uniref:hypothetical protein n=1 Tax=Klebsiella pneumoniae TaxID=573 RepID=UPI0038546396